MLKNPKLKVLLAVLVVFVIAILIYLPNLDQIGMYRDDWNNFYTAVVRGPEKLLDHYASDRPADGILIGKVFEYLGTDYTAYHVLNLILRIFGAVCFTLSLFMIWPNSPEYDLLGGILMVIYPGFLQQIDGIAYVPHQTAMTAFLISLLFTAICLTTKSRVLQIACTIGATLGALVNAILMEYFIGMEAFRLGLIFLIQLRKEPDKKLRALGKAFLMYIPLIAAMGAFVIWRSFFFEAKRNGTDVMGEVITPLITHPKYEGLTLLSRIAKNLWKLFVGVWTIPVHNLVNGLDMKHFWGVFPWAFAALLFSAASFQIIPHINNKSETDETHEWVPFGLLCGTLSALPLVFAGRDINFTASLDRFAWPGAIGSICCLLGIIRLLHSRYLRLSLLALVIFCSAFVQVRNREAYIETWSQTQDYWQQLLWRAPGLERGTTIVTSGAFSAEEDYEIFGPANMIYYPHEGSYAPIGAEILNTGTVRDIEMGEKTMRTIREVYVEKDYQQLLVLTKPTEKSCLQIIDGKNPIYSHNEWSKITEVGSFSKLEQIINDPEHYATPPFFLNNKEQEHGWCYYYEIMELALQNGDAETAAALADEAAEKGLRAEDWVEWVPVIEAYIESGRPSDAEQFIAILQSNGYLQFEACRYFGNKTNPAYQTVLEMLCE